MGWAFVSALWVSLAGIAGCAAEAAAPGAKEPRALREPAEPSTIEEAEAQLERARAELGGTTVAPITPATGTATTESGPGASGTTPAGPPPPSASTFSKQEGRCGNACGAMSSMRRAVDAICRMAGESDARCTDARRTLKDSETKVAGCGCPPT